MAEPVDRVGELGLDRRVDVRVVDVERLDRRLDLAAELLEDQVLVLHLGDEPGGLEEPLAVPAVGTGGHFHSARAATPLAEVSLVRVFLMSSTSRSCSEWNTWWMVVRPMFSLTRPSPAMKCAFSISSS